MTTICFQNDKIILLFGKHSGKSIFVSSVKVAELSEGSVINGVVTDRTAVSQALIELSRQASPRIKRAALILDSSLVYSRQAVIPLTSKKRTDIIVANEFSEHELRDKELVFDYSFIGRQEGEKSISVLCYAVEKSFVGSFIELFKEAGIGLSSIDISTNCIVKYMRMMRVLNEKSYIVSVVDKNAISLYLFTGNVYYYSVKGRLLSEKGTLDFYQEISSQISSIIQFNKSQRNGFEISDVFLCGLESSYAAECAAFISDLGINTAPVFIFNNIIERKKGSSSVSASDYLYNIGGLIGR